MTLFNNQLEYFFIFKVKDDSVKIGKDPYAPVVLLEGPSYTANLNLLIFIWFWCFLVPRALYTGIEDVLWSKQSLHLSFRTNSELENHELKRCLYCIFLYKLLK